MLNYNTETQTTYASFFSMISSIAPGYAGLGYNTNLIDARLYGMMNDTDFRKQYWFNGPDGNNKYDSYGATLPYANTKFGSDGNWTMDYVYMRAAEMVLIEAEALARQGKNTEAATALKKLMAKRDPSWNMPSVSAEDVVLQRRIELWGEGFSNNDCRRLNKPVVRFHKGEKSSFPDNFQINLANDDGWLLMRFCTPELNTNFSIVDNSEGSAPVAGQNGDLRDGVTD